MKATVIGRRSHTSAAFDGARWYQPEPSATSAMAVHRMR